MVTSFTPDSSNQLSEFVYQMPLPGLLYIDHKVFADDRGSYAELARIPELDAELSAPFVIKQLNLSVSKTNVIRGFHAEAWNKLLSIVTGTAFCAWADLRPDSASFGQVTTMTVGQDHQGGSVFVSSGIANSFCALAGPVNYLYGVDKLYAERDTSYDLAISLFDPDLAVEWPIPRENLIISQRDLDAVTLRQRFPEYGKGPQ